MSRPSRRSSSVPARPTRRDASRAKIPRSHGQRQHRRLLRGAPDQPERRAGDDPSRLPPAGAALSSRQQGVGQRGALPPDQRGVRGAERPGEARPLRRRLPAAAAGSLAAGRERRGGGERFRQRAGAAPDGARGALHAAPDGCRRARHLRHRSREAHRAAARAPGVHALVPGAEEDDHARRQLAARHHGRRRRIPRRELPVGHPGASPQAKAGRRVTRAARVAQAFRPAHRRVGSPKGLRYVVTLGSPKGLRYVVTLGSPEGLRYVVTLGSPEGLGYCARNSLMLPLTVLRSSSRPPLPIRPCSLRRDISPVIVTGNSLLMLPFDGCACRSASRTRGSVSVMPPLTVVKLAPLPQSVRPIDTFIDPLTVLATAVPVVSILTDPLTVLTSTSP